MYLLDTNVISELRRNKPHGAVLAWLDSVRPARLCLSVATVGEIQAGVERVRTQDPDKARQIEDWASLAVQAFEIFVIDAAVIRLWARLSGGIRDRNFEDTILAATAMIHGLTMVTRNVRDFERFEVPVLNPFDFGVG
jgi:predicted nucleic acid-binding protein